MHRLSSLLLPILLSSTASAVTLTLDRAPDHAVAHNRQLAAARLRIAEARGRLLGSGRLRNPELEAGYSQNVRTPEREYGAAFVQRFPLTARLRLERAVSQAQLDAAQAEIRDAERRLVAEVRAAAVRSAALRAQRELREQQLATSREQAQFVSGRVAAGEVSAVDAAQAGLESRQLEVEILQADALRAAQDGELRTLLGLGPDEPVEITGTLAAPGPLAGSSVAGAGQRPDLEAARHNAEAARQSAALARARRWEDIAVGLTVDGERSEDAPEGRSTDHFAGLKFSLPLPLWNRNEGQIAEAAAAAQRAGLEAEALALSIRTEAGAARAEMAALGKLATAMDTELLPKAQEVEAQLRASYGSGLAPLTEVLRARARRLELAQRRIEALRDYHLARVRLEAALGRNTPRTGGPGK